jgi:hypothetical protein
MLRLLAQREQGYEDMAALMGVSVEELRGRVKDALGELEREGEEAPSLPPAPEPQKAAPEPPKAPAAPGPPAAAEPPEQSAMPPAPPAPPPPPPPRSKGGPSFLASKGARIGIAAVAGAVAVVVVLLIVLGGGSDSDSSSSTETTTVNAEAPSGAVQEAVKAAEKTTGGKAVTKAVLTGVDGAAAEGIAIFGRVKNKLALQILAEGLEPLGDGETYAIWIAASPTRMLPLAASPVSKKGQIASQFEVPTELLAYLANGTFDEIAITRASISELNQALKSATKAKQAPSYTGTAVMRGTITGPIIGAAKRLEEKEK